MKPQEIYDAIETAWKDAALSCMVLKEITEGRKQPNPAAFTFDQQLQGWTRQADKLRSVLDGLADLKAGGGSPEAGSLGGAA